MLVGLFFTVLNRQNHANVAVYITFGIDGSNRLRDCEDRLRLSNNCASVSSGIVVEQHPFEDLVICHKITALHAMFSFLFIPLYCINLNLKGANISECSLIFSIKTLLLACLSCEINVR